MIVRDIVKDALTEVGFLRTGETPKAEHAQLALRTFQRQLDAWQADRLTLSLLLRTPVVLPANTTSITIGIGGTVPIVRPTYLTHLNYVIPGSSPEVEVPVALMDNDAYAGLSIKSLPSTLPTQAYYDVDMDGVLGTLSVWPMVTAAVKLYLYSMQAVGVPATLNDVLLSPAGYQEAFHYQLALRLITPFGINISALPLLPDLATKALATMKSQNVYPGILSIDAALVPNYGAGYNALDDTGA
jgi:hypothetical protein